MRSQLPVSERRACAVIGQARATQRRTPKVRDDEAAVYDFVTELYANKGVSDTTYARALQLFGEAGIVDILGVVGYYATNAMIMNVARTRMTDGRLLPLTPVPAQMRLLTPGAASPEDYTMLASQAKEFDRTR